MDQRECLRNEASKIRPSAIDVYKRLLILKHVVVHAVSTPPKRVINELFSKWGRDEQQAYDEDCKKLGERMIASLKNAGLWDLVSPKEGEFLASYGSKMDEQAHLSAFWRVESASMLMWALQMIPEWPKVDRETNPELLKQVEIKKVESLSTLPSLRPDRELDAARDLIKFWHWRVRTRKLTEEGYPFQPDENMKKAGINSLDDVVRFSAKASYEGGDLTEIIEEDFVFLGKPFRNLSSEEYQVASSIISERHFAMNWICGEAPGNRWDETPTGT